MSTLASRLRDARKRSGLTLQEAGRRIGVSHPAIIGWESGKTEDIKTKHLVRAARAYGASITYLATGEEDSVGVKDGAARLYGHVPLVSWSQLGGTKGGKMYVGEPKDWLPSPVEAGPSAVALEVQGRSMEPTFREGEIVFVDPDLEPRHDSIVVAELADGTRLLRRLTSDGGVLYLEADNSAWPDRIRPLKAADRLLGVVVFQGRPVPR